MKLQRRVTQDTGVSWQPSIARALPLGVMLASVWCILPGAKSQFQVYQGLDSSKCPFTDFDDRARKVTVRPSGSAFLASAGCTIHAFTLSASRYSTVRGILGTPYAHKRRTCC